MKQTAIRDFYDGHGLIDSEPLDVGAAVGAFFDPVRIAASVCPTFGCVEVGIDGGDPYFRGGVGLAILMPGIELDSATPDEDKPASGWSEETIVFFTAGAGPASITASCTGQGSLNGCDGDVDTSVSIGPSIFTDLLTSPSWRSPTAGGGFVNEWVWYR